jgi:hypothetical protein
MARCMCDWQWDLAKNAAKPLQFQNEKKKVFTRRRTSTSRGDS